MGHSGTFWSLKFIIIMTVNSKTRSTNEKRKSLWWPCSAISNFASRLSLPNLGLILTFPTCRFPIFASRFSLLALRFSLPDFVSLMWRHDGRIPFQTQTARRVVTATRRQRLSSRLENAFNRSRAAFLEEAQDILQRKVRRMMPSLALLTGSVG